MPLLVLTGPPGSGKTTVARLVADAADLSVHLQRACGRSGQALTDPGPVARMHSEFAALGPYERHVIDSSVMSPQDTAEVVRSSVATGTMRLRHS